MARKVKPKLYPSMVIQRELSFPQTPFHKLVYSWLKTFERDGDLWNALSALRSCDVVIKDSKHSTTMRLRTVLGLNSNILGNTQGKIPACNELPLTRNKRRDRVEILAKTPFHFQQHWQLAVNAVRYAMDYDLDTETKKVPERKRNGL